MPRWIVIAALLLLPVALFGQSEIVPFRGDYPPELPQAKAYTYKTVGDAQLQAWVYQPDRVAFPGPRPAIVFFFGGGWRGGTPQQFQNQCRYLAARGMVAVTADYRVKSRQDASPFDCVEDAKSAIRWVRQQSGKLGVDPQRVVASGGSAGGHTACCTGVIEGLDAAGEDSSISSVPNAMALFNPAVMLAPFGNEPLVADDKLKDIAERIPGDAAAISPIHHVRENLPPTIIFHGTDDTAVPFVTVQRFTQLMNEHGNRCELKVYPGQPHGFFNPRFRSEETRKQELKSYRRTVRQLDAFLVSLGYLEPSEEATALSQNVTPRGRLINSLRTFEGKQRGHVAFLGGSITEMNGYRPMLMEFLTQRFPQTEFQFTNAGIASTCSTTGAFRLERDVLSQGPVDLLFVEFAVNDDQDAGHSRAECVRGMEGIIRHLRTVNPSADIVMTFFVNPGMLEQLQNGRTPLPIEEHLKVAEFYEVPTVHLAREVAEQIQREELTWKQFGGTHPAPFGNRIAEDLCEQLLTSQWNRGGEPQPHPLPNKLLDNFSYVSAHFVDLDSTANREGWTVEVPDWKSLPGSKRERFTKIPMLCATEPGASFQFPFEGSTAVAYVSAGPDAGQLEVSVDGGPARHVDLFHHFSKGLHYPRSVVLASDLPPGKHTLTVVLSGKQNPAGQGTAARIMELGVNGPQHD